MSSVDNLVDRYALEDREEQDLLERIAPLAARLQPGINYYTPDEFFGLLKFFEDSIEDKADAIERGVAELFNKFALVRVLPVYLVTASDVAERAGVNRTTAVRWLHTSKAPFCRRGKKKLYNITGLDIELCKVGENHAVP